MALNLVLYAFSKKQNSTAIPPQGGGTVVPVTLKNETSLNNPTFILSGSLPVANYAQFESAFYFIDNITNLRDNLWEVSCSIDVLATYRAAIRNTSAYVEYATQGNADLIDARVVPEGDTTPTLSTNAAFGLSKRGLYVLSAVGSVGVTNYIFPSLNSVGNILSGVVNWADALFSGGDSANLKEYFKAMITQGSAMDAIRSCIYVPLDYDDSDIPAGAAQIVLGNFDTGAVGAYLQGAIVTKSVDIDIPFSREKWLRLPPYTDVGIYLPFAGVVNIQSTRLASSNSLHINISINVLTGEIGYELILGGKAVSACGGNCSVHIPVGISNTSPMQLVNGIASAAISAGYGNLAGAAGSLLNSLVPTPTTVGGIQGGAGAGLPLEIYVHVLERPISGAVGNMAAVQGLPLFATRALSSLSGYVQTRGASVSGNMRGVLREQINTMLDNGIFLE